MLSVRNQLAVVQQGRDDVSVVRAERIHRNALQHDLLIRLRTRCGGIARRVHIDRRIRTAVGGREFEERIAQIRRVVRTALQQAWAQREGELATLGLMGKPSRLRRYSTSGLPASFEDTRIDRWSSPFRALASRPSAYPKLIQVIPRS